MPQLSDLIVPENAETIEQRILDLLEANDFPVAAWEAGSWPRLIIRVFSEVGADVWYSIAQIANGLILETSTGAWLTLYALSAYAETRKAPVSTVGKVRLTDAGAGPHTITANALVVATSGGLKYRLTSSGTLPLNGTLDVDVTAEAPGGKYNVPVDEIDQLVTTLPTVTVSNPAVGTSGTWITTYGADVESDAALRARLPLKWATLATGSPPSAYLFWALSQVGVTRAKVDDGNPDGPGSVRVYIDSSGSVSALQTFLNGKKPVGTKVTAMAAVSTSITIPGTVTVSKANRAEVEAQVVANLTALSNEIDIGGIVREAEVIERIMAAGAIDFDMGSAWAGSPNIQLTADALPSFTLALTYVEQ